MAFKHNRGQNKFVDVILEAAPPGQEEQEPLDSSDEDGDLADEEHEDFEPESVPASSTPLRSDTEVLARHYEKTNGIHSK